ncbi:MAG: Flp pilus assembly complex ATPase component TadA [Alphaproteobacteria bacterium]|nr:Flp pilus assembly complex ATPase component TadA [Alphaproteobacteria bacterium]MBQ8631263.1 Flp pilus assembly complex ATPase component TadA [Alphaproteobacteria bacterium]
MAEEDGTGLSSQTPEKVVTSGGVIEEEASRKAGRRVEDYFPQGVTLLTLPNSEDFIINDDTRRLLALFSNGLFLVSETHKFDGRVLSFEVLARKKKVTINKPTYVSQNELNAIYTYGERAANVAAEEADTVDLTADQMQMQKDFVQVVERAAVLKVSDIHIVVADSTQILFRINGMMQTMMEYNKDWGEAFVRAAFASSDISDANYTQNEFQAAQKLGSTPLRGSKGKLMLPHNVLAIRLQFNPIAFGSQYLVMRLLYADDNPDGSGDLQALGFGEYEENLFYRLRAVPVGISIIAGPTGSGKSTTLQRNMIKLLQEKNYEINLLTVEDPPEYPIPGARQMPVTNANTEEEKDEQFNKALAAALRSDPDVIMVGEVRTLAAAQLAFKGALSGHGMWTTLHANSAPAIITRLMDMGVEPFKLTDPEIMKGLISQRLFRKLCPHCRVSVKEKLDQPSVKRLKTALGDFGIENTYIRGPGCKYCGNQGVKGRMSVPEIILPDATFLELMTTGETRKAIDYWTGDLGGRTLRDAAIERMLKGYLDLEEIERWCGLLDQRPSY